MIFLNILEYSNLFFLPGSEGQKITHLLAMVYIVPILKYGRSQHFNMEENAVCKTAFTVDGRNSYSMVFTIILTVMAVHFYRLSHYLYILFFPATF